MSEFPLPKINTARQELKKLFEQGNFMPESERHMNSRHGIRDNEVQTARSTSTEEILKSFKHSKDANLPNLSRAKKSPVVTPIKKTQDETAKSTGKIQYNRSRDQLPNDNQFIDDLSRDISYMRDKKEKAKSQLRTSERQLKEILGVKKAQIQKEMPLPIDIKEIESILMNDDSLRPIANGEYLVDSPLPSVEEEEKEEHYDDKMHENFIHDLIHAKKSYYDYRKQKRAEIQKDTFIFKTPTEILSSQVPKLYGLNSTDITKVHKRAKSSKAFDRKLMDRTLNQLEEKIVEWANTTTEDGRASTARGPPSGRREVELLEKWLNYMLDLYVDSADYYMPDQRTRAAQLIYTMCFKEVIRQVSVHCVERGKLIDKIWKASMNMYSKHESVFIQQIDEFKQKFKEIVQKTQKRYESNLEVATKRYSEVNAELRKSNKINEDLSKQIRSLNVELDETKVRNKQLKEAIDIVIKSSKEKSLLKAPNSKDLDLKHLKHNYVKKTSPRTRSIATCTSEDFERIVSAVLNPPKFQSSSFHLSRSPILIQGYFDEAQNYHRTRQFHNNSEGKIVGVDYDEDIISIVENKSKGTDTSTDEDIKVMFLTEEECRYIWDRMICLDNLDTCNLGYIPGQTYNHDQVDRWKLRLLYGFEKIAENMFKRPYHVRKRNAKVQMPESDEIQVYSSENSFVKSDSDDDIKVVSYKDTYKPQIVIHSPKSQAQISDSPSDSLDNFTIQLNHLRNISERVLNLTDDIESRNLMLDDPVLSSLHAELLQAWSIINEYVLIIQNLKNKIQTGESCNTSEINSDFSESASEYSDIDQDLIIDIAMRMGPLVKIRDNTTKEEESKIQNVNTLERIIKLSARYNREIQRNGKNHPRANKLLRFIIKNIKRAKYARVKESWTQTDLTWEMVHVRNFLVAKSQTVEKLTLRSFEKKDEVKEDRKKVESLIHASEIARNNRFRKEDESTPSNTQRFKVTVKSKELPNFNMFSIATALYAKRPHPASALISKVLASNKNKSKIIPSLSVKSLGKIITNAYVTRIISVRENSMLKRVPLYEMLYDDLNQKYGLKKMTDKKMKEIINSSLTYLDKSIKIHNFMKFLGLFEDYTVGDLNHYISAFEYLAINASGQLEIDDYGVDNQVHISKALSCAKVYFEEKLPKETWEKLKLDIESLKELDTELLKSATKIKLPAEKVNIDKLLSLFISYFHNMKRQVHKMLCDLLDDEIPPECGFTEEEFIDLVSKLNPNKLTRDELSNSFEVFGDFIIGEESDKTSKEKMMLLEHVLSICVDLGLVGYNSKQFYQDNEIE